MHILEASVLSTILLLFIFFDVRRYPLPKQDKGSRFFAELAVTYTCFLVLNIMLHGASQNLFRLGLWEARILWALHVLSIPFLLTLWVHFSLINVAEDTRQVSRFSTLLVLPLVLFAFLVFADLPVQQFYPATPFFTYIWTTPGSSYLFILSSFLCLVMLISPLWNLKTLQGSKPFLAFLLPFTLSIALATFRITHELTLFVTVNSFMLVLNYLVIHRDAVVLDDLTNLSMGPLLQRRLIKAFRNRSQYSLLLVDVENFRLFNSRHGRNTGDRMLQELAAYLKTMPYNQEAFRLKDDRFCLLLHQASSALECAGQLQRRMEDPWQLGEETVYLSLHLLVIHIPEQASSFDELMYIIEQMLQQVKTQQSTSLLVYDANILKVHQHRLDIISALREAIRRPEQVQVYYQPIHDNKTGALSGAEALMRIQNNHLGFLQPDQFIPIAEQTGLIRDLTFIVLDRVCALLGRHPKVRQSIQSISVNLSAEDFTNALLAHDLLEHIQAQGIAEHLISFEITESMIIQSHDTVKQVMHTLSSYGIQFALDDFGSGYSNFSMLMDLPLHTIKFDKQMILKSPESPQLLALLSSMLHALGKTNTAEGVACKEEALMVQALMIDRVQGYYYSEPLAEDRFLSLFANCAGCPVLNDI
jgi:diguanylate cyclase (GGDEF)-like protein